MKISSCVACVLTLLLGVSTAFAQTRDKTPPTQPTNLRVVAVTAYSVTLAWNPSRDNSGQFTYTICCANVSSETGISGAVSTHVYRAGLEAGRTFSLRMYAVDAAGNYSKPSNSVTFTLARDVTPPTTPVVSLREAGVTYASLAWSSTDDGPNVWYTVFVNGIQTITGTRETAGTIFLLQPASPYTITVKAQDFGGHKTPLSQPLTVTTQAANPNDITAPTTPTNLSEMHFDDAEIHLSWDQSTDDFDPQWIIRYDVFVNGELSDITIGRGRSIVYGTASVNNIRVEAVDQKGNRSVAATIVVSF
jgi:cellulose 1,4-beta-cellobiosidase